MLGTVVASTSTVAASVVDNPFNSTQFNSSLHCLLPLLPEPEPEARAIGGRRQKEQRTLPFPALFSFLVACKSKKCPTCLREAT